MVVIYLFKTRVSLDHPPASKQLDLCLSQLSKQIPFTCTFYSDLIFAKRLLEPLIQPSQGVSAPLGFFSPTAKHYQYYGV